MSTDLPMGDRAISRLVASGSETGAALRQTFPVVVLSATGQETRPDASVVIWLGSDRPAHMASQDLWFNPADVDTFAPTPPSGLTASNVTTTGFTLTWSASTDNTGVAGYEVYLDGTLYAGTQNTTLPISGLAPNSSHTLTVRAKDDAQNWSAQSSPLTQSTLPPEHTVYGTDAFSPALIQSSESPSITVATAFYTYGIGSSWQATGARLYVPQGLTPPSAADFFLWSGNDTTIDTIPLRTKTMSGITTGWNQVHWDTPFSPTPSQYFWIGYRFPTGEYLYGTREGEKIAAEGGVAEAVFAAANGYPVRSQYQITGSGPNRSGALYGIDVITA